MNSIIKGFGMQFINELMKEGALTYFTLFDPYCSFLDHSQ